MFMKSQDLTQKTNSGCSFLMSLIGNDVCSRDFTRSISTEWSLWLLRNESEYLSGRGLLSGAVIAASAPVAETEIDSSLITLFRSQKAEVTPRVTSNCCAKPA